MDKIKAVNPNIIVRGNVDKPYYLIEYYDLSDNEWHIGYGSYCLANVKEWLKTCFEVTNADVAPVKHGHWEYDKHFRFAGCSECEAEFFICDLEEISGDGFINFCPNCGARMDGGNDNDR